MTTTAAEIAKTFRATLKAGIAAGAVTLPEGAKVSVKSRNFAGGCAVDVALTAADEWALTERPDVFGYPEKTSSSAARALGGELAAILKRAADGRCWGEIRINGYAVDGGIIHPATWRPGQD